jgi:TusA-related sulfurtransferase
MPGVHADHVLDAKGLLCPLPVLKAANLMRNLPEGKVLEVLATDEGVKVDFPAWCRSTGNEYLGTTDEGKTYRTLLRKRLRT